MLCARQNFGELHCDLSESKCDSCESMCDFGESLHGESTHDSRKSKFKGR